MMNTILVEITYFALPLFVTGAIIKYFFKLDINILIPSAIMLLLFVIMTIFSLLTLKKFETELFAIFCVLQLLVLIGSILLMSKQDIIWKHFFVSLPFQFFYWALLFYYGGILFTHKFEA